MLALLLQTGQVSGLSRHPVKHTMLRCPLNMFHMKHAFQLDDMLSTNHFRTQDNQACNGPTTQQGQACLPCMQL